jgi:PKD repeat protein
MRIIILLFSICWINQSFAQCETVDFALNDPSACIGQPIIVDYSSSPNSLEWDFCPDDLLTEPVITEVATFPEYFNIVFGLELVFDGINWYGFATDRTNGNVIRLDYGNSLQNTPTSIDLGTFNDQLASAEEITIKNINGTWYALITNSLASPNNYVSMLDFGESLNNESPTYTNLGNFEITNRLQGVDFVWDGNRIIVVIANASKRLVIANFGNDLYSNPIGDDVITTSSITFSTIYDVSIYHKCNSWYFVIPTSGYLNIVNMDLDLFQSEISSVKHGFPSINLQSNEIKMVDDGENSYAFISSNKAKMVHINLGTIGVDTPIEIPIDITLPEFPAFDIEYYNGSYILYGVEHQSDQLFQLSYSNNCGASIPTSGEGLISQLSYSSSGDKKIVVKELVDGEIIATGTKTVTITTDIAPSIAVSSQNICRSNPITFSSSSDQTLNSQTWDFGDTNTSTDPNPSHTYAASGEYEVTLEVESANGCQNLTKQTITIYDEPVPDFTLPVGSICTSEDYMFVNNTIDNFDGNLTYEWQIDDLTVSTHRDFTHQFTTGGAKSIKLITSIPGCDIVQEQILTNVTLGAVPSYGYDIDGTCQDDPISFTNLSSGADITDYLWDFGDTSNSSDTNPTHAYSSAGEFTVSLAVTNAAGCTTIYQEDIVIHSLPTTDFSAELGCSGREIQLSDLTTVDNANITSWDWDFGDVDAGSDNISAEDNPTHLFTDIGDYDVTLSTTTNFGCQNTIEKVVTIYESPNADFEVNEGCVENAFDFTDLSTPNTGGSIVSRTWDIDGSIYTVPNPSHTFTASGNYLAILTIRSDNSCTVSVGRTVTVNTLPTVDFTLNTACANTESILTDASIIENDEIVNWIWTVNGQDAGTTSSITYVFEQAATYEVDLQIITERGCIVSRTKSVEIFELPTADFEPSKIYSAAPAEITFDNLSINASVNKWDFGDGSETSSAASPIHTYTDLGTYEVTLTTQSPDACYNEVTKQIHVVDPIIDLSIDEINTFDEGKSLLFTISNYGTIPVGNISANVSFNQELSIIQPLDIIVQPKAASISKTLSFTLPENGNIDFICITLSTTDGADDNTADNTQCINISDNFRVLPPYPSPVSQQELVTIPIIGEENDQITIALLDASGKQHVSESVQLPQKGLNDIVLSLTHLKPGIYFIQVQSPKTIKNFRIFVN